jgi:hypothetical protein
MPGQPITQRKIADHVSRLGDLYPPIALDSVDRTVHDPGLVASRFGHTIDYLARVELEVDRNVLELLVLLPDVDETNKTFYADVWAPQEIQHGLILDRLQTDIGRPPTVPQLDIGLDIKILGALAHIKPVQDVTRMLYFLTGASTERQAVLAYNRLHTGMIEMGETAVARTILLPIKQQEPGHFAFYQMSAMLMIQDKVLKPWQLFLARVLREKGYYVAGGQSRDRRAEVGRMATDLGVDADIEAYAREIGRVESRLLWAGRKGMESPPYIVKALRQSIDAYREQAERSLQVA